MQARDLQTDCVPSSKTLPLLTLQMIYGWADLVQSPGVNDIVLPVQPAARAMRP
jgi:hypothetical protein